MTLGRAVRRHPRVVDLALVAGFGLAVVVGTAVHAGQPDHAGGQSGLTLAFAAAAYGAVLVRRRWPKVSAAATVVASAAYLASGGTYWWIVPAPALAMFHLASTRGSRVKLPVAAGLSAVALLGIPWLAAPQTWWGTDGGHESSVALLASCVVGLAAGDATRNRRAYLAEVEERARQAVRDRDREAQRQVAEERLRIARDLHDSIGHHLAIINAQAGMADRVFDQQPDAARAAVGHIKAESRSALDNLRDTVGLLRQPDEAAPTQPPSGLAGLDGLVDRFRRSGLPVQVTVAGAPRSIPWPADQAAYRIVQESLTNAAKHSPGAATSVRLDYKADPLTISVQNDPASTGGSGTANPSGHGIVGMRERTSALGGTFTAGPRADGGYAVYAALPLGRSGA